MKKIVLHRYPCQSDHAVFRVVECAGIERGDGEDFKVPSGKVASLGCPEWLGSESRLYVWGAVNRQDSRLIVCTESDANKIISIVREFNEQYGKKEKEGDLEPLPYEVIE